MDKFEWQRYQNIVKPNTKVRYTGAEPKQAEPSLSVMNAGDEGLLIANDVDGREDLFENLPVSSFNDPHSDPFYIHPFSMDYWLGDKWVAGQRVYDLMLIAQVRELVADTLLRWPNPDDKRPVHMTQDEYWLLRKVAEMWIEESISLPIDRDASGDIWFLGRKVVIVGRPI